MNISKRLQVKILGAFSMTVMPLIDGVLLWVCLVVFLARDDDDRASRLRSGKRRLR